MKIRFWGTRGSTPAPLTAAAVADKLERALAALAGQATDAAAIAALPFHLRATYGGNTSCVEVIGGDETVILDAGTGLRGCGERADAAVGRTYHLLLSHTHWDHISGLPFFRPAFVAGNRIVVYGCHPDLEGRIATLFAAPHFPVRFERLAAEFSFVRLRPGRTVEIAGLSVTPFAQRHPGASYGYRLARGGRSAVYSTDSEHNGPADPRTEKFVAFCRDADLLIFDAMYPFAEAVTDKAGWGHSSNVTGIEIAKRAAIGRLCLFHHDPMLDDEALDRRLAESRRYAEHHAPERPLAVSMAYDGLEIEV